MRFFQPLITGICRLAALLRRNGAADRISLFDGPEISHFVAIHLPKLIFYLGGRESCGGGGRRRHRDAPGNYGRSA
jgi:hypothetical protein